MDNLKLKIWPILILFLLLVTDVYAISGSIGNAKMIFEVDFPEGEIYEIERTILVSNLNDVAVKISLEPKGDLVGITEIIDQEFELAPGEEKDAVFKITLEEHGDYEGDIAVSFTPLEGSDKSVGLLSNIQITANGEKSEQDNQVNPLVGFAIIFFIVFIGFLVFFFVMKKNKQKSRRLGKKSKKRSKKKSKSRKKK